jgi:hypothetical protein
MIVSTVKFILVDVAAASAVCGFERTSIRAALSVLEVLAVFDTAGAGEAEDCVTEGGKAAVDEFVVVGSIIIFSLLNETQLMSHES